MTDGESFRVAVIGAGPSGIYATQALLDSDLAVSIDVIDRLPTPYGLVRYGVAPDHVKMKSVIRVLRKPFEESPSDVHFIGNVTIGTDLSHDELLAHYHAVIYTTGMPLDRGLGIPGEDLLGSLGSAQFVNWYCGHPDAADQDIVLDAPGVAVVGAGNVALDVARVLAKSSKEMESTDVPDRVLDALAASEVQDIYVLIRRGPEHVKFTPAELRQIGELGNADVLLYDHGLPAEPVEGDGPQDRRTRQSYELLRSWVDNQPTGKPRRIHLRFLRSPVEILGDRRVQGVVIARNQLADSRVRPTGDRETLDVGMIVSAVGYRTAALPGLPQDPADSTVPNEAGRVINDGQPMRGCYVAGWVKRGPTGVIGTNKNDAGETVQAVLADLAALPAPGHPDRDHLFATLTERGADYVDWDAWLRLDAAEVRLGAARGAERVKVADLAGMLGACQPADTAVGG